MGIRAQYIVGGVKRYSAGMNRGVGRTREGWGHYIMNYFPKATRQTLERGRVDSAGDLKKNPSFSPPPVAQLQMLRPRFTRRRRV